MLDKTIAECNILLVGKNIGRPDRILRHSADAIIAVDTLTCRVFDAN